METQNAILIQRTGVLFKKMERIGMLDGKKVKVVIKEVYKHTAACEACRVRKRKCDGRAPCAYCESKNITCQFAEQRKRGPKKARIQQQAVESLGTASYESQILDHIEANNYVNNMYVEFVKMIMPCDISHLMTPTTVSHKIQSYAALAIASRIVGDSAKSKIYIATARQLAGSVFDSPDPNTIAAMLMMSQYWYFVLDMLLSAYYSSLACNLAKASPMSLHGRLGAHCQVALVMLSEGLGLEQRVTLLKKVARELQNGDFGDRIYGSIVEVSAYLLGGLGFNSSYPDFKTLSSTFDLLDNVTLSEEDKNGIIAAVEMSVNVTNQYPSTISPETAAHHATYMREVYAPTYSAIASWKSGHITEALNYAMSSVEGLVRLKSNNGIFGILAKYANLSKLVFLSKFLYEQGQYYLSRQMCGFVKEICETMRPEYDFLATLTENFIQMKLDPIINSTISFSSPENTPSPPSDHSTTPSSESDNYDNFHLNIIDINTVSAMFEQA